MIDKSDWSEEACLLCMVGGKRGISISRMIEKLDEALAHEDYAGAVRLLEFWRGEAVSLGDTRGELAVENEMLGLSRRLGERERGLLAVERCLSLVGETSAEAVIMTNAATTLKAFGEAERAIPIFERAGEILSREGAEGAVIAAHKNNLGTALTELGRYEAAQASLEGALSLCREGGNAVDEAITLVNLAQLAEARGDEFDVIEGYLTKAEEALDSVTERGEAYAFALRKCAPTFGYYGFFLTEKKFNKLADVIYENN